MAYTDSVDEYNEHWSALQSQFQFAVPYLETWHRKRHLWSYAWTHLHFNNGSTANSVAESSNGGGVIECSLFRVGCGGALIYIHALFMIDRLRCILQ